MLSNQNSSGVRDVARVPPLKSVTAFFRIRDGIFVCVTAFLWYPVDTAWEKMLSETPEMTAFWKMLSKKCCRMTPFLNLHFTVRFSTFSLKMLSDDGKNKCCHGIFLQS